MAERDFRLFCETHLSRIFCLPWSDDHLDVLSDFQRVAENCETQALAMPRATGKTMLCMALALWCLLTGRHQFVVLLAATDGLAGKLLDILKSQLETNEMLAADWPEICYPIQCLNGESRRCKGQRYYGRRTNIEWGKDIIVLPTIPGSPASGSVVRSDGITGSIRGMVHSHPDGSTIRPTLAVVDDPQTDEVAASLNAVAKRLSIINGAIYGLAGPGKRTSVIVPCTVIRKGDLADQLLSRDLNPVWQGRRTKFLYDWPKRMDLWEQYAAIMRDGFRRGEGFVDATRFYEQRREEMDAGATVSWKHRYNHDELSALQNAMNLYFRKPEAFWAEYQNEPVDADESDVLLQPEDVQKKLNGVEHRTPAPDCNLVTAYVDVHDRLLYWMVCAWEANFTGYVIDYGVHPEQRRRHFAMRDVTKTLRRQYPGSGKEAAILAGLCDLLQNLLACEWKRDDGARLRVDLAMVDSGYVPKVVHQAIQKVGSQIVWPSKGVGVRASRRPFSAMRKRKGELIGDEWMIPSVKGTKELRHVLIDTNHWKTFIHDRLKTGYGDPGSLTLWGGDADRHRLVAEHLTAEYAVKTEANGRTVNEWSLPPNKPDNHWFDCLVGCAVAASIRGVSLQGPVVKKQARRRRRRKSVSYV